MDSIQNASFHFTNLVVLDIDECATERDNCDRLNGICNNTEGSFECSCNTGYIGDGISCSSESTNIHVYQ